MPLKSIVRRDDGASYDEHVRQLMAAEDIEEPTPAQQQRFDRRRKKSLSNRDSVNPHDPEARIKKMKDGRTHLAYKAEHVVDLETGAVAAVTVQPGDRRDTSSMASRRARERQHGRYATSGADGNAHHGDAHAANIVSLGLEQQRLRGQAKVARAAHWGATVTARLIGPANLRAAAPATSSSAVKASVRVTDDQPETVLNQ